MQKTDLELKTLLTKTHQKIQKKKEDHITQLTKDVHLVEQQRDELVEEAVNNE